jgi:hypothetical protein
MRIFKHAEALQTPALAETAAFSAAPRLNLPPLQYLPAERSQLKGRTPLSTATLSAASAPAK